MKRLRKNKVVVNDKTRLFIQDINKPACYRNYAYHSCVTLDNISINKSDSVIVYQPSVTRYDEYDTLARLHGKEDGGSSSLRTNFTLENSTLKHFFDTKCLFDMQVHIGHCSQPNSFAEFDKALIFKNIIINNYNIESPMADTQANRDIITETVDVSFEKMYEVALPKFVLNEGELVKDGVIIDSFTFCDESTCLSCVGSDNRYFVQLVSCGAECQLARVIYTNGYEWRQVPLALCDSITCDQAVNTNLLENNNNLFYVNLSFLSGKSVYDVVNNSVITILGTQLLNTDLIEAYSIYGTTFFAGTNGRIFISKDNQIVRLVDTKLSVNRDILSIHSIDGLNFIAGSEDGRLYTYIDGQLDYLTIANANNFHSVAMINSCTYIAATSSSGAFLIRNGRPQKISELRGTVTKFAFYNEDIGVAVSVFNNKNNIWLTVNGGQNWQVVDDTLDTRYVISTLSVCQTNHNNITIAGRKMSTPVSITDMLNPGLNWNCQGTGFVYLSK